MSSFPLLQLPDDILHKIFQDDFDWNDQSQIAQLFQISLTCKRLHNICLTSYLSHFGITNPRVHSAITIHALTEAEHDAICGLRAALFVPSIEHLSCTFVDAPKPVLALHAAIVKSLMRLYQLIQKLNSLTRLTLHFSGADWNKHSVHGSDSVLSAWCTAIGSILELCLQKGCTHILIHGGKVMCYTYQFTYTRSPGGVGSRMGGIASSQPSSTGLTFLGSPGGTTIRRTALCGPGWEFKRVKMGDQAIVVDATTHPGQLKSLTIGSSMCLLPPLSNWTLSVLPSLTELVISHVALASHIWHALLPTLAFNTPELASLTILVCPDISIDDILCFLALLPKLHHLRISDEEQYMPESDTPIPELRYLRKVEAPWRILMHIAYSALPDIREIKTFPRRTPRRGIDWDGTGAVMRALKASLLDMPELERLPMVVLKVVIDAGWVTRLNVVPSSSVRKALRLVNVLEIEFQSVVVGAEVLGKWITEAFESLKEIRLQGDVVRYCGMTDEVLDVLRRMVASTKVVIQSA